MRDRVVLQYKPRAGPRRRVIFEPDHRLEGAACDYCRIEEVYSTAEEQWRETGREHVTEPDIVIESEGLPELAVPTQEAERDA